MDESNPASGKQPGSTGYQAPSKNIVDTAMAVDNLKTLATAIHTAGLIDALAGKGPFTLFAPSDEAFRNLPRGAQDALFKNARKLKAILEYHLIAGHILARDLKPGEIVTRQGTTLIAAVSSSGVQVNDAHVEQADLVATNGVVHVIDAVMLPKNWQLLAAAA
jgi:uncharacterized surface protein with fasciclin (FAS1) repeats